MIGLGLGTVKPISSDTAKVFLEKDLRNNPDPIKNLVFVEGESNLVYKIIFNILTRYNPETLTGSYIPIFLESLQGDIGDVTTLSLLLNQEILRLEGYIRQTEDPKLADNEKLQKLELIKLDIDYKNNTITIHLKITNRLNKSVLIAI